MKIKKMWHRQITEYYSALKTNGNLPFVTLWMDLEDSLLSEVR
jgi:hypothetical protein